MESFSVLGVEVIQCSIQLDVHGIVTCEVKFREIEGFSEPQINENVLVVMKTLQRILKKIECYISVDRIFCKVEKIKDNSYCPNEACI